MSSEYLTLTTAVVPVGEWSTERKKKNLKYFDKKKNKRIETRAFSGSSTRSNSERVLQLRKTTASACWDEMLEN